VTKAVFYAQVRRMESRLNAGVTTHYQMKKDETYWYIAGNLVGISDGPVGTNSYYMIANEA
jgi:hypothetical protein